MFLHPSVMTQSACSTDIQILLCAVFPNIIFFAFLYVLQNNLISAISVYASCFFLVVPQVLDLCVSVDTTIAL
jgi:hypothetical protein